MQYHTVKFDSVINIITRKDELFLGAYTVDPYQKCEFNCVYCDSSTTDEVVIKKDIAAVVDKELCALEKGVIIIGSVHDPYQPVEEKTRCMRRLLEVIKKHGFPVHILTKSMLVLRDVDLLLNMSSCVVTVSMVSVNQKISRVFEPYVPSPNERLRMVQRLSTEGIPAGVAIMPIIPYVTDIGIERLIKSAKDHDAQYIIWEYLELKGDQRGRFMSILKNMYPEYENSYMRLYANNYKPSQQYVVEINKKIRDTCDKYGMKSNISKDLLGAR